LKRALRGCALLVVLAFGATVALADPVQQFDVQVKDITAGGRYSVVFTSNSFDTTGGPPPALTQASLRLPKGIAIRPEFLKPDRLCQAGKLRGILLDNLPAGASYKQMLGNLPAAEKRIGGKLNAGARQIVESCRKAYFGSGSVVVDARPLYADPVPGLLYLFLAKPTAKGAVAGIGVVALYDRGSPLAQMNPRVADLTPAFTLNIFNDPTPDGRYGYRVKLLPERVNSLRLSVAELRVESRGIVASNGDFWASAPRCPASGKLGFKADYSYATGQHTSSVSQVPCPRFKR
jgi:hypothetical protein